MEASSTNMETLPSAYKALVLVNRSEPLKTEDRPMPEAVPGSAIVRILAANVISYTGGIVTGKRPYTFPTPMVPGASAVGRIAAVGRDSTFLKPGQLVIVDTVIRSRDNPTDVFLAGIVDGFTAGSKQLMAEMWRDATFAEYVRTPLESCFPLDEVRLTGPPSSGGLGYSIDELPIIFRLCVPYGGLVDVDVKPGETVVIAPATGGFGGAAVKVALAMGANVIAMGRNRAALDELAASSDRVRTVQMTGDYEDELKSLQALGPIDVFFDISPPFAGQSTHFKAAIMSLVHSGRVSLMGGLMGDFAIPHHKIMHENITLKGRWMYEPADVRRLIKMVENGLLPVGNRAGYECTGKFPLEQWREAFDNAAKNASAKNLTLLNP